MTTLEETGIQIRTAVLNLQKLANQTRTTDPETASEIDGIANSITEIVDGKHPILKQQETNDTPVYTGYHDAVILAYKETTVMRGEDATTDLEVISETSFMRELQDQDEFEQDVMAAFDGLEKAYSHWPGEYVGMQLIVKRDYVNMT